MSIPEAYTVVPNTLRDFLQKVRTAGVPPRVTNEFLKTLGFKSSNDRSIISVLKAIGFLDASGAPTDLYRQYRDPKVGPTVLAEALRQAYSDIFLANEQAHTLKLDELKGIIAAKTTKGERAVTEIARTFSTLAKSANFDAPNGKAEQEAPISEPELNGGTSPNSALPGVSREASHSSRATLHYNIQIHLPTTTDITVYNAIFKSLRESLL